MPLKIGKRPANNHRSIAFESAALQPGFRAAVRSDGVLEMLMYEEIGYDFWSGGGITSQDVKSQLDRAGTFSRVLLRINSPGGDAFEGVAIGNILKASGKPVDVVIDGLAASAASIVAMCGSTITMASNAMMMIHNAWTMAMGDSRAMLKMGDTLGKIDGAIAQTYVDRTGKSMADVKALMDEETWMTAADALAEGFCTKVDAGNPEETDPNPLAMARSFKLLGKFKKVPKDLKPKAEEIPAQCECDCQNCMADDCENCINEDCVDENCQDCPMQTANASAAAAAAASAQSPSNLSLYEAQLARMQRRKVSTCEAAQ